MRWQTGNFIPETELFLKIILKGIKMNGITEEDGVPHVWGIPCIRDRNYRLSLAEYFGLTFWLCPYCDSHLIQKEGSKICINDCHIAKNEKS